VRARLHFRNGSGDSGAVSGCPSGIGGHASHSNDSIPSHCPALSSEPTSCRFSDSCQLEAKRLSDVVPLLLQVHCRNLPPSSSNNPTWTRCICKLDVRNGVQNDVGSSAFHPRQQENWGTTSSPFCPSALRILIRFFPPGIKWRLASRWLPPGLERANQHFSGCLQPHSADRLSKSPLDRARICPEKTHLCGVGLIILYRCKWRLREQRLRACTNGRIPRTWNASDLKKTWWSKRSSGHFFCVIPLFYSRFQRTTRTLCFCSSSIASGLVPSTVLLHSAQTIFGLT
jgi:hypothetical protein